MTKLKRKSRSETKMKSEMKTTAELLNELREIGQRIIELESANVVRTNTKEKSVQENGIQSSDLRTAIDALQEIKEQLFSIAHDLNQNDEYYRLVTDNVADVIVVVDNDLNVRYVSPSVEHLRGYTPEEAMAQDMMDTMPPASYQAVMEKIAEDLATSGADPLNRLSASTIESEVYHKDGSIIPVEICADFLYNAEGQLTQFITVMRNTTERKNSEKVLEETEQKFYSLYNTMAEGVCLHEIIHNESGYEVDYRILDINPSYATMTGLEKEKAVGSLASKLYGTGTPPYLDTYAKAADSGLSTSFETYFPPMDKHFKISVSCPGKGKFATIFSDITNRKQAEEALRNSQTKLQTMVDTISDAINLTDLQGNIIDVNLASPATFGFSSKEEIIGHHASEFIAKQDQTELLQHMEQTFKQGHGDTKEYRIVKYTGEEFDAEVHAAVLRDGSGEPIAFMSITRDVTAWKQARQSLENKVEELERYKKLTIDRELRMIELKELNASLEAKVHESP